MNGYILIDKPLGWTSFDVVARVRRLARDMTGEKLKVGHAGTLDPLATGLLILLLGKATKQQDGFMKLDKSYEAEITLGSNSSTYDAEGELTHISDRQPMLEQIQIALQTFIGPIEQMPPQFSAIKIDGKRAYELARAGKPAELKSRTVTINDLEITTYNYPKLVITTDVSSGTYIRSLAYDIGDRLGTGAYISSLRRTRIGEHSVDDAVMIDHLNEGNLAVSVKPILEH